MNAFRFYSWPWLLLVPVVLLLVWWSCRPALRAAALFSNVSDLKQLPVTLAQKIRGYMPWAVALGLSLLVIALARPQMGRSESKISTEGIAIELVIDVSGSMETPDFKIDGDKSSRISAVKNVVEAFINGSKEHLLAGRPNDLIGLVTFGGFADSRCPLTLNHGALTEALRAVEIPKPKLDGRSRRPTNEEELETAIGDGILAGADRLKDVKAKSKILILLTDGDNNLGSDPHEAAKAAEALGIKVYTICIGTNDAVYDGFGNKIIERGQYPIDEPLLQDVAQIAHGKYWHAYGTNALTNVYEEIDKLEKTTVEETRITNYDELFAWTAIPGLALLFVVYVLSATRFRTMP